MRIVSVFLSGLLFGAGLIVSGMANPAKVLGFLDIFGEWDASLAFVMGAAVTVTLVGYRVALKRHSPLFSDTFALPARTDIDSPLLVGPTLFGIGWGLVGLCPGPAVVALVLAPASSAVFVLCMLAGMYMARTFVRRSMGTPIPN